MTKPQFRSKSGGSAISLVETQRGKIRPVVRGGSL